MSQNPYSPNAFGTEIVEPPRTSLSAIGSLVTALLCCIPGAGILATLLGAFAIVRIGSSGGRKSGKFLAIAGIVIGLLVTAIWLGMIIGAVSIVKNFNTNIITPMTATFEQLGTGDKSGLTSLIDSKVLPADARAQADRFWAEVTAKHGQFKSFKPKEFGLQINPPQRSTSGSGKELAPLPLPAVFANGNATVIFMLDPDKALSVFLGQAPISGIIQNIEVHGTDGSVIQLLPSKPATPALPAPSAPTPPAKPETPAKPAGGA